jgi:iron complex outermembrane receptor protein
MSARKQCQVITRLFASASIFCLPVVGSALAQDAPAAPAAGAPASSSTGLEEIVVVAQKRSVNIQKAPEAITAVTGAQLDQANVVNPVDLNGQVPSLVITTSEGFNNGVAIRGVGFNVPQNDAAQPSVSYHTDGIYVANPVALNTGFLDVDHVEVLRGPQGTVFGQNSVGGTINVISKLPTLDDYTGFADISTGSYSLERFRGALNVPVNDTLAIRAAVDQDRHDGFANATMVPGTGGHYQLSNDDSVHARLEVLWKPTDDFTAVFRAEYATANNNEAEFKNILDPNPNPYEESSDWPGKFIYRQEIYSATLTYNMDWATLKSLTSWQSVNQSGSVNEDGLSAALAQAVSLPPDNFHDVEYFFHNSQAITQEVDLSSLPGTDFDWIVGGFFLNGKEKVGYDQYALYPGSDGYAANQLGVSAEDGNFDNIYFQSASRLYRQSYSFYGQGTFHISDRLRFTGGARYTRDADQTEVSDFFNPNPFRVEAESNVVTGKAEVEYDLTPDNMVYASFTTGFKPGGGNISDAPQVVPYEFKPETIQAYEIGSKNSFMDNKIRLNTAAFYYNYSNLQYEAEDLATYQGGVANIPSVAIYGAEAELSYLLPYNLRFDANGTIEKGRITSHFLALDNVAGNNADIYAYASTNGAVDLNEIFATQTGPNTFQYTPAQLALFEKYRGPAYHDVYGNSPPMLPEVTISASLTHTLDFGDSSQLLSRVQVQYRDSYANAIFGNSPIYTTPSYVLWNLYFDYSFADDNWDASFAIDNVLDKAAVVSQFTNQFGGETSRSYEDPRQFIVRVGYKF